MTNAEELATKLRKAKRSGREWSACCPAHDDEDPSFSFRDGDKGLVFKCFGPCSQEDLIVALEALGCEIRKPKTNGNGSGEHRETLTLDVLASAKKLPLEFLVENRVHDDRYRIAFDYLTDNGELFRSKYRKYLTGEREFTMSGDSGKGTMLYGLWRFEKDFANDGRVILCEGETDALTLWFHGFTALGVPGADQWKDDWIPHIPDSAKLYVTIEPDDGGKKFEAKFRKSKLLPRLNFIRMPIGTKDPSLLHCIGPDEFQDRFEELIASAEPAVKPKERRIVFRHIAEIAADRKETDWLIEDTIERRVIALMVGARGSLKSFVALDWLMRCAIEGKGAIALSAEGDGLGRRIEAWHKTFAPVVDLTTVPMVAMERSISLCVPDVLLEMQEVVSELPWKPEIMLIDTLSKYSAGLDENENSEVRDFLEGISQGLRNVFGCTVLLVAHTGYGASDRIRGASSFGANTEAEYIVTRPSPQEMLCKVTRERFKDSPALEPLAYQAEVVDLGRQDKRLRSVTSLVLKGSALPPPKARAAGANQTAAVVALREWVALHPTNFIIAHDEMAAMFKRQGISAKRKPEVLNWLVNAGILGLTVGGHKVNPDAIP